MEATIAQINELLAPWNHPDMPGGALVVVRDGGIVLERSFGCANLEHEVPITASTVFHVASVSKQFTAMATLLLEQDGRLSLQDDVRKFVPELPDFGHVITLEHLIHHMSGLREIADLLMLSGWRMSDSGTNADALEATFRQTKLNYPPGDGQSYTNTGYLLLATVISRVSGKSLRDFAAERIFAPLGMTNTQFNDDHTRIVKNRASAYAPGENGLVTSVPAFDVVGSTGLLTTAEDMARWDRNLTDGTLGGHQLVQWMQTPGRLNDGRVTQYGGGLYMIPYRGVRTVQHAGGDAGYRAQLTRFPDQRLSVILLCNLATIPVDALALQVAEAFLADQLKPAPAQYPPTSAEMDARAGLYWSPETQTGLRLELRDGKLITSLEGGAPLDFISPNHAAVPSVPASIEFVPRAGDRIDVLRMAAGPFPAAAYSRVTGIRPSPAELAEYAGDFHSDEIGSTLSFSVRDDCLVMSLKKYPDMPLTPTFRDHFAVWSWHIAFCRDAHGRVAHLAISTDRSRGLLFTRGR